MPGCWHPIISTNITGYNRLVIIATTLKNLLPLKLVIILTAISKSTNYYSIFHISGINSAKKLSIYRADAAALWPRMELFMYFSQSFLVNVGINLGCGDIDMSEHLLNTSQIRSAAQ